MNKLKIGKIIGTHALKGELKIRSNSDFNDQRFVVGRQLLIGDFQNAFIIKTVRFHKGNFLVSFEGLQNINLVEKYVGLDVYGYKEDVEWLNEITKKIEELKEEVKHVDGNEM